MGKLKAFLTGMLAGAAALFLSKKENREQVADKAEELKDKAQEGAEELRRKAAAAVNAVRKTK